MSIYDDIRIAAEAAVKIDPPIPALNTEIPSTGTGLSNAETLQQAYQNKQKEAEGPWILQSIWNVISKWWDWLGDQKDHIIDNEDEDMGITDWKAYKKYEQNLSDNDFTDEEAQQKTKELFDQWVITQKYFSENQKQYEARQKEYSSSIELQQKVVRDLTAQVAPYMARVTDVNQRRLLQQAIETQTATFMDYYSRITDGHDTFDKDKYLSELATFMDDSQKFIKDYSESIVQGQNNQEAFLAAQKSNLDLVKRMDGWNTNLRTDSLWKSASGSAKDIFDYDGVGETVWNIFGTVTGGISLASNLLWRAFTESPIGVPALMNLAQDKTGLAEKNILRYNSGFEELGLDAVDNTNDGIFKSGTKKIAQGLGELVDGADSIAEALIPMVIGGGAGLLGKAERAARLTDSLNKAQKLGAFGKTLGVTMLQDALVFDASFTSFQGRGNSEEESAQNAGFSLALNSLFVAAFAKPVLRWSKEFRTFFEASGGNVEPYLRWEWVIKALNEGNVNQAERLMEQEMIRASRATGEDAATQVSEAETLWELTETGLKNAQKTIEKLNKSVSALLTDETSDVAFEFQKSLAKADAAIGLPSEAKLIKQQNVEWTITREVATTPSVAGKLTFIGMNTSPEARTLISDAINATQAWTNSVFTPGTALHMTDEMKDALLNKLMGVKTQVFAGLNDGEKYWVGKTLENLDAAIKKLLVENPGLLSQIKRDVNFRLASEVKNTSNTSQKLLPSYEEAANLLMKNDLPAATYTTHTRQSIDAPVGDMTAESLMPPYITEYLAPFVTHMKKSFWIPDSDFIDTNAIKKLIDGLTGKTSISAKEIDAFKFYHLGKITEDADRLKWLVLTRDVSDKTLFQAHPFFKLFTPESTALRSNIVIHDPRDIENLLGQVFMRNVRANLNDLPVMKYILKNEKFKSALINTFIDITKGITNTQSAAEIWKLVDHMFMDAPKIVALEKHWPEVFQRYVDDFVKLNPILEGSRYDSLLKSLLTFDNLTPANKYQEAATKFDTLLTDLIYGNEKKKIKGNPAYLDKETLRLALLAKGMDELTLLHTVDFTEKMYSYTRSALADAIAQTKRLVDEWGMEITSAERKLEIDAELAGLSTQIKKLSSEAEKVWPRDNLSQVIEKLDTNPLFDGTIKDTIAELPSLSDLIDRWVDMKFVEFSNARKALAADLMSTTLNQNDFRTIMQFLSIPFSMLQTGTKAREEYINILNSLTQDWSRKLQNFMEWFIYEQYAKSVKNLEESIKIMSDATVRLEREGLWFGTSADNLTMIHPSQVPPESYIIVGRSEQMGVGPRIGIEPNKKAITTKTLYELRNKTDITAPIFMTRNSYLTLLDTYKRNPSNVLTDIEVFKRFKSKIRFIDIDLAQTPKWDLFYLQRGYDDIRVISDAISRNSSLFTSESQALLKKELKPISEKYWVGSLDIPTDFARAANLFDGLFTDPHAELAWTVFKDQIPANTQWDVLPFLQGKDFPEAYAKHIAKVTEIFPGAKEFPWFLDAFKLNERQFHEYSMLYQIGKKTNKNFLDPEMLKWFATKIKQSFMDKLIEEKSPAAQKYATYKILSFLMSKGVTVPDMPVRDLLSLVDGFAPETNAMIGKVAKDILFDEITNTKVWDETNILNWVTDIEESLKYESSLDDLRGSWGLQWEMRFNDATREGLWDLNDEVVDSVDNFTGDFADAGPRKLEDVDDAIELFQAMGTNIQNHILDVTKKVYLGRNFVPYFNREGDISKLLPSDFNREVRALWEKGVSDTTPLFTDPRKFELDPSVIGKDPSHKFYVWNGADTVQIKNVEQARDEVMLAIKRASEKGKDSRSPAFQFYATPNDSKITLATNKKGKQYFTAPEAKFIDPKVSRWLPAYMNWWVDVTKSPLFRWAFADELAKGDSLHTIIRDWQMTSKSGDDVLRSYEKLLGFEPEAKVKGSGSWIDYLGELPAKNYKKVFNEVIPEKDIQSVRAIWYRPVVDAFNEFGETVGQNIKWNRYMFEWDTDKLIHEFFEVGDLNFNDIHEVLDFDSPPDQIIEVLLKDGSVRRFISEQGEIDVSLELTAEQFKSLWGESVSSTLFSRSAGVTPPKVDPRQIAEVQGKKYSYLFDRGTPSSVDEAGYRQVGETVINLDTGKKFKLWSQELSNDYVESFFRKQKDLLDEASGYNC